MKTVMLRLPDDLKDRLDAHVKAHAQKINPLLVRLIELYLEEQAQS